MTMQNCNCGFGSTETISMKYNNAFNGIITAGTCNCFLYQKIVQFASACKEKCTKNVTIA